MVWERDGNIIDMLDGALQLQLLIPSVEVVDQGNYTCRVELSSPHAPRQIGPVSGGTLTVLGKSNRLELLTLSV